MYPSASWTYIHNAYRVYLGFAKVVSALIVSVLSCHDWFVESIPVLAGWSDLRNSLTWVARLVLVLQDSIMQTGTAL